jgi:hypothetical protein
MLLTSFAGTVVLLESPFYQWVFVLQLLFYGAALFAGWLRALPIVGKAAIGARYFVVLNAALALGTLKFLFGRAGPTWNRTKRREDRMSQRVWDSTVLPDDAVQKQRPAAYK